MTETPLEALIARLEAADGPAYALEVAIAEHIGFDMKAAVPRAYTASLDAALSLVPEGWLWDVASTGCVWVMPEDDLEGQIVVGGIATPPLALCIAALRARAALPREEG